MCVKTALNALKIGHTLRLDSQFINILLIATLLLQALLGYILRAQF